MAAFTGKTIIVTGASEGIGRALCQALAPQKPSLVLAARNEERLEELKGEFDKVLKWLHMQMPIQKKFICEGQ